MKVRTNVSLEAYLFQEWRKWFPSRNFSSFVERAMAIELDKIKK